MQFRSRGLVFALALAGVATTVQPAAAFFGSFAASCRSIRVYGGGAYMTAWCRRIDGSWNHTSISNCGGAGVRNANGYLVCGTD